MKILHLISNSGLGGAQIMVRDLIQHSQNQYVYAFRKDKNDVFEGLNDKVFYCDLKKSHKFNFRILFDLKRLIKKHQFSILHTHLGKPLIYAYLLKIFNSKLKIIHHEHGLICGDDHRPECKTLWWYKWYLKLLQGKVDQYILISKFIYELYKNKVKLPENKLKLLYNFIDPNKHHRLSYSEIERERNKLNLKNTDFVVGFAGRLVARKGWDTFLQAAKRLTQTQKNYKFLIAGSGPGKDSVLSFIHCHKLSDSILYLGFIKDMNKFYAILNCLCMVSHWEPMGLAHIEAQACGAPVIATDIPGLNETLTKNNCFFIKKGDYEDLVTKLELLKNNPDKSEHLIKEGYKNAKKYSLEDYLNNLKLIYHQ